MAIAAADIDSAMECTLTVERIDTLTEASRDLAFDRPEIWSRVGFDPVGSGDVASQAHRQPNHGRTGQGRSTKCVELIQRRTHFVSLNLLGRRGDQRRLRLQTIERGNFAGDRAQRCHLQVALFGDLFQAGVIVLELIFLGPQLVKLGHLQQHAGIRAGNSGQAEESDGGADDENVEVMDGNGDLAQLPVVPAGHEKDVEPFLQNRFL